MAGHTYEGTVGIYTSWTYTIEVPSTSANITKINSVSSDNLPSGMVCTASFEYGKIYVTVYGTPTYPYMTSTAHYMRVTVNYTYRFMSTSTTTANADFYDVYVMTIAHIIAYNGNGATGGSTNSTIVVTNWPMGSANVTFASNGFTAPSHYHFGGWRINNTGTVYQPGNTYEVAGGATVTAYAYWVIDSHTVTATSGGNGSVSGGGTYNYGSTATLTATPNANYRFDHWSDNTTTNPKTFTVTGNVSLTAYFVLDAVQVTGASNGNGSVTGSGQYNIGSTATLTAVPDTHYKFIKWNDDTTANPKSFTVTQAVTYTATFGWAYPNIPVKVNGDWVDSKPYVKVNGDWVQVTKAWVNDNGTWKEIQLE